MIPWHGFLHGEFVSVSQHGVDVPFSHIFFENKLDIQIGAQTVSVLEGQPQFVGQRSVNRQVSASPR